MMADEASNSNSNSTKTKSRKRKEIHNPDEIFFYLTDKTYPSNADNNKKRSIRRVASRNYKLENGKLWYRIVKDKKCGRWRKVIRKEREKMKIIHRLHTSKLGTHCGRDRTLDRVQKRYWWPSLRIDVTEFIKKCERCKQVNQKTSNVGNLPHPLQRKISQPWLSIGIDLIGPLQVSPRGNKYICTVTCCYTKMAHAKPLPTKEAVGVARVLYELFLCFGFPKNLLSDQCKEFNNAVVGEIARILKTCHRRTSSYHPQCNVVTGRCNQTLEKQLLKLQKETQYNWDEILSECVFAYNTAKQSSTRFSPFYLMFGRDPIIPEVVEDPAEESHSSEEEMGGTTYTSTEAHIEAMATREPVNDLVTWFFEPGGATCPPGPTCTPGRNGPVEEAC